MEFRFYVNPEFIRNGEKNVKIMVHICQVGWYGVFCNVKTNKVQKQVYNGQKPFDLKNVYGNGKNLPITSFQHLQNVWNTWSDDTKKSIYNAAFYLSGALSKFTRDYYVIRYSGQKINDDKNIREMTRYIYAFIKGLHDGNPIAINQDYENGCYTPKTATETAKPKPEQIQEVKTRKSVRMFKMMNASNLSNLFENNIYPIIRAKDGYYTVKDEKDNEYTIRANRGREIQVFTECPA